METKLAPGYMSRVKHVERISRMRDAAEEMYELLERYFNSANGTRCEDEVQEELESCDEAWSALRERINA